MKRKILSLAILVLGFWMIWAYQVEATAFSLSETNIKLNVGEQFDLDALEPEEEPIWLSYNENIAQVDENGVVTALNKGKTKIRARIGSDTKLCSVNIVSPSIKINKQTAVIYHGGTSTDSVKLKATVNGANKNITWISENPEIATVDESGLVKSVAPGTAKITVEANGITASCEVTVKETSITLPLDSLQLGTKGNGSSYKLVPDIVGSRKKVVWTSSDENVAKVNGGKVTGKNTGTAIISAEANGVTASCTVEVTKDSIAIKEEIITLYCKKDYTKEGCPLDATAVQLHSNYSKNSTLWSSSAPEVVAVDENGKVTIQPEAEQSLQWEGFGATYLVYVQGIGSQSNVKHTCKVLVVESETGISTSDGEEKSFTLKTNGEQKTETLICNVVGEKKNIKWESSAPAIATVNKKGKVTAKKAGTAYIYATANGVRDSIRVTVEEYEPTIKLDKTQHILYTGKKGNTVTLKATVDGADKKVTWDCVDSDVVTVSSKGKVKVVDEGIATVTATANGVTASCKIIVKEPKTELEKDTLILKEKDKVFLSIDVVGKSQNVKWTSTNNKIVSVDNGKITAKKNGEANIQATANGITSVCHVIVSSCSHTFDDGVITKEATCTEKGIRCYTCSVCNASYEKEIALKAHEYDEGIVTKEATCTEKGEMIYSCISCGKVRKKALTMIPHVYDEEVTEEATCERAGKRKYTCKNCNNSYERTIPMIEHEMGEVETLRAATCSVTGDGKVTCVMCGKYSEYMTLPINPDNHVTEEEVCIFMVPTEDNPLVGGKYVQTPRWRDEGAESDEVAFPLKKYTIDDIIGCIYEDKECFKIKEPVNQKLICAACEVVVETREHTHYLTSHLEDGYDISASSAYCLDETCCYRATVVNPVFNFLNGLRSIKLSRIKDGYVPHESYHIKKGDSIQMNMYPAWTEKLYVDDLSYYSSYWHVKHSEKTLDPDFEPFDAYREFTTKYENQIFDLIPVVMIENEQIWGPYYTEEDGTQYRSGYTDYDIISIYDTEKLEQSGIEVYTDPITKITTVTVTDAFNTAKDNTWYTDSVKIEIGYAYPADAEGNLIEDILYFSYIQDLASWSIYVEKDSITAEEQTETEEEAEEPETDEQPETDALTSEEEETEYGSDVAEETETEPETETEEETETEPETETEEETETEPETETEEETETESETETEEETESEPETETVEEVESKSGTETEEETESESETETVEEVESKSETETEPKTESESKIGTVILKTSKYLFI